MTFLSPTCFGKVFHKKDRCLEVVGWVPLSCRCAVLLSPGCLPGPSLPVVYHHGSSATGGHYTTDVFQIGLNGWLRIDDQTVKVINQYQVVKPTADRTAYLLYYRRVDLL